MEYDQELTEYHKTGVRLTGIFAKPSTDFDEDLTIWDMSYYLEDQEITLVEEIATARLNAQHDIEYPTAVYYDGRKPASKPYRSLHRASQVKRSLDIVLTQYNNHI
ncbi:hypothetical protein M422DRAFT_72644 [Sphaerobolus stellatus SS14]|nr:hypothetical protein M422DRAFT_72644 [Sphaerobolus stellatus SS14]